MRPGECRNAGTLARLIRNARSDAAAGQRDDGEAACNAKSLAGANPAIEIPGGPMRSGLAEMPEAERSGKCRALEGSRLKVEMDRARPDCASGAANAGLLN